MSYIKDTVSTMPSDKELVNAIEEHKSNFEHRFIPDYEDLKEAVEKLRDQGKKIVLTQGVYDLVHEGHALYLEEARKRGDVLIVGVDTDNLTKKRKGPDRPVVPEEERVKMLVHFRHVDLVTFRYADDGEDHLLEVLEPDVLIVSESTEDIKDDDLEYFEEVCGEVCTLPPQATTSTTARIRKITIEGVNKLAAEIEKSTQNFIKKIKGTK